MSTVEVAPAEQLFRDPRHPYTRGLLAQPRCGREDPALVNGPGDPGHLAACHYAFTPVPATTSVASGSPDPTAASPSVSGKEQA